MQNLKELKGRIKGAGTTLKVFRTYKTIAISGLSKTKTALKGTQPYVSGLNSVFSRISPLTPESLNNGYMGRRKLEKVLIVSITSNKRFCGPFNKNTLEETGKAISDYQASIGEGNAYVYSIGEIGGKTYEKKGCQLTGSIKFPEKSIFEGATRIAEMLMKWFASGEYDAVEVVYHRFENAKSKVAREQFLPLPTKQAEKNDAGELAGFISEPSPDAIINALAPRLLKARFRGMLMSSYASESHLRMIAMTRAVKKTQELIDKLNRQFNKARQERITREIIEINAGAIPQ